MTLPAEPFKLPPATARKRVLERNSTEVLGAIEVRPVRLALGGGGLSASPLWRSESIEILSAPGWCAATPGFGILSSTGVTLEEDPSNAGVSGTITGAD
jgi:hypothetical protein